MGVGRNFLIFSFVLVFAELSDQYESNEIDLRPLCSTSKDMFYANCFNLRRNGLCENEPEKMKYYCPIGCQQCQGPLGKNRVSRPPLPKCLVSKFGCCKDNETIAQGKDFLGCPEKCFDTPNYNCDFFKKIGFCGQPMYKKQMLLRCPLSCEYCKPVEPGVKRGCFDEWRTEDCKKFRGMNLCNTLKWGKRLEKRCKKTCQKCKRNRAPALLSVASECSHDNNCCWDRSTPINGRCPVCADRFSTKFCKNFLVDCFDTTEVKGVQIRVLCSRSCGLCSVPQRCTDDIIYGEFCEQWKELGHCKSQPYIMKNYCKKTCGFC